MMTFLVLVAFALYVVFAITFPDPPTRRHSHNPSKENR